MPSIGSEQALWQWVKRHFNKFGFWERIENNLARGTPDLHYCINGSAGWIELKQLEAWPMRETTKVQVPTLTIYQRTWHEEYAKQSGRSWLLLRVGMRDYLLFAGSDVKRIGDYTRAKLYGLARFTWKHQLGRLATSQVVRLLAR